MEASEDAASTARASTSAPASEAVTGHETPATSVPPTPKTPAKCDFVPLVTVVGFHHARGPEVETWFGVPEGSDPAADYDWSLLPFMALSDGAHASNEDFSYFTLLRPATDSQAATSLFGISCTRQIDASQLLNRPADVTRSTVQKAVVVIADSPQYFGVMRERLSVVTQAWFAQREFTDTEILRRFQESLADEKERGLLQGEGEEDRDQYLGMSLRELVREFKWQTLVLLKCCLLQPKMLFFGSRCERLCMMQFSLISLIPGLIRNLQDCADPELNAYEDKLVTPTTLRTSDRTSLLAYMGLPLQIFAKGSLFGPYTPLQQLDILADFGTKSYIVGSTNSLLLQQKDRYSDILIHLDDKTVNITSPSLKQALVLSAADRRWIDYLTQEVNDTWDDANPGRPKTMGYVGSEEFIRLQFEEYILSLISSFKYHKYLQANQHNPRALLQHIEYDPALDFGPDFIDYWSKTENHRMWNAHTDSHLFDVVEPKHPCAGGLTIDDVQRRIAQQVQEMHLDERFAQGREALGRNFAAGREKASTMFNKFYADMEAYREAQRQRAREQQQTQQSPANSPAVSSSSGFAPSSEKNGGPAAGADGSSSGVDMNKAQQNVQSAGAKAGAYMGSWVTWAGEKRKGWGAGWSRRSDKNGAPSSPGVLSPRGSMVAEKEGRFSGSSFFGAGGLVRKSSSVKEASHANGIDEETDERRPATGASFGESIISAAGTVESSPASPRRADNRPASGVGLGLGMASSAAAAAATDAEMDAVLQIRDVSPAQPLPVLGKPEEEAPKEKTEAEEAATPKVPPAMSSKEGEGTQEKHNGTPREETGAGVAEAEAEAEAEVQGSASPVMTEVKLEEENDDKPVETGATAKAERQSPRQPRIAIEGEEEDKEESTAYDAGSSAKA